MAWTHTAKLQDLLTRSPQAHALMCWLLCEQRGGTILVTIRGLQHSLKASAPSSYTILSALQILVEAKLIEREVIPSGTSITILNLEEYSIVGIDPRDVPSPALYKGDLYSERRTVLNAYRRTVRRGDNAKESEAAIQWWLEGSVAPVRREPVSVERLVAAAEAYEGDCVAKGRTYRRFAQNFFDPENGIVEEYLPEEFEVEAKAVERPETVAMREVFRVKE